MSKAQVNEIWEEFNTALRQFIFKRIKDAEAADDILQDTFIKIHDNIDYLKDENKLKAWLYKITRNSIIDYYRDYNRRCKVTVPLSELPEYQTDNSEMDEDIPCELESCVKALVDRLPDRYREPLILTEFKGLTQKEMGNQLGLSVSGAKSRVQRGREMLKCLLEECCSFEVDQFGNIKEYKPKGKLGSECCKKPAK